MSEPKPFYPFGSFPPQPEPSPRVEKNLDWHMCDHCGNEIEAGEEGFPWDHGVSGRGKRSNRPMFVDSPNIDPSLKNKDLHYGCVPHFIVERYPDIAEMIVELLLGEGWEPDSERLCVSCESKLVDDDE